MSTATPSNALASLYRLGEAEMLLEGLLDGVDVKEAEDREAHAAIMKTTPESDRIAFDPEPYETERAELVSAYLQVEDGVGHKVDSLVSYMDYTAVIAEAAKSEAERCTALRKGREGRVSSLKRAGLNFLRLTDRKAYETQYHKIWRQDNGGVAPLGFANPDDPLLGLPEEYILQEVTLTRKPDTAKIRLALAAGKEIYRMAPDPATDMMIALPDAFVVTATEVKRAPNLAAIAAAAEHKQPIYPPATREILADPDPNDPETEKWVTVPIAAAYLAPKGEHLRTK